MTATGAASAYVAIGAAMTHYAIDIAAPALSRRGTITLPARVQYSWAHPKLPLLYVGCADRGGDPATAPFMLCVLRRDEAGDLGFAEEPTPLPARPIHLTVDPAGRHVLIAYGGAPGLTVFRLGDDGSLGAEVPRAEPFDFGASPHQVRVMPGGSRAVLVARGKKGFGGPGYRAGGFKLIAFTDGVVENVTTVAPSDADAPNGFNPRDVDFHPDRPLMYATLEAQNELTVFALDGDTIDPAVRFTAPILADPATTRKRQDGGPVHLHPAGTHAYAANRNDGYVGGHESVSWLTPDPVPVFPGGENNIAVFRLDPATGAPTPIQHIDTRGLHPRTFAFDPSGRVLIAANIAPTVIEVAGERTEVPASLAVFRIKDDCTLDYVDKVDLDTGPEKAWWMGIVG